MRKINFRAVRVLLTASITVFKDCVLNLFFTVPVWHEKMSRSYSSHSGYTMTLLCENKFSQLLWLAFSCLCCSNWRDTRRLSLHEVLRWKHSRDKMRKLKKELVWGVVGRYNMCAGNATFHSAPEVCLNCGVFSWDQQQRYKPLQQLVLSGERKCVLLWRESLLFMEELVLLIG